MTATHTQQQLANAALEIGRRFGIGGPRWVVTRPNAAGATITIATIEPLYVLQEQPSKLARVLAQSAATLGGTATALASTAYHVWGSQGRITRLPEGMAWGRSVSVVYIPMDDRPLRTQVLLEIVRLALSQTAMQSEDRSRNGMKYAYQAPDWEKQRKRLYRRLEFPAI